MALDSFCLKENWTKKTFWQFLKNTTFSPKPDDLKKIHCRICFPKKVCFYIRHFISFQVMSKTNFTKLTTLRWWHHP